ncbi:hypothetical protein BJX70DRAFT_398965 [Aspergillus crustosus]
MVKRKLGGAAQPKKATKKAKVAKKGTNKSSLDQDFTLLDIPDIKNPRGRAYRGEPKESPGSARAYANRLEEKVSAWVEKYVIDDITTLETKLSSKQMQGIITAADGYCAQCPLEVFELLLPAAVYQVLPKLLAHAILNKSLWQVIADPFHSFDPEYTYGPRLPFYRHPPEGFASYLDELYERFNLSRRDDAVKWRQLTVRLLNAEQVWVSNGADIGHEARRRRGTAIGKLSDQLSDPSGPLSLLLKGKSASKEQKTELDDLCTQASEFSILCGLTELDFKIRKWKEIALYRDRGDRMLELASVSEVAQEGEIRVGRVVKLWPVVIMVRPPFSYYIEDLQDGPERNERVITPAIVVVAKHDAPVFDPFKKVKRGERLEIPDFIPSDRQVFAGFGPEIENKVNCYFPSLVGVYNNDRDYVEDARLVPLGSKLDYVKAWRDIRPIK